MAFWDNFRDNSALPNLENIPTCTIIPDPDETIFEDSDENDGIGLENYGIEADKSGSGLDFQDDRPEEQPQKSQSFPLWFKKALEEKLAIIEKKDSNNRPTFYDTYETFWVPKKARWFIMIKAKSLDPEALYDFELFY